MSFLFLLIGIALGALSVTAIGFDDSTGQYLEIRKGIGLFAFALIMLLSSLWFKLDEIHKTIRESNGKQTTTPTEGVRREDTVRHV